MFLKTIFILTRGSNGLNCHLFPTISIQFETVNLMLKRLSKWLNFLLYGDAWKCSMKFAPPSQPKCKTQRDVIHIFYEAPLGHYN